MKKLVVLGCPGSGKSHLARKLHEKTGIPLYPLDRIWWREDRTHVSRPEFDEKLGEILRTDAWILDGDYSRTYEVRLQACDTVLFLDYDEALCIEGVTERVGTTRADCPFAESCLDPVLLDEVKRYRAEKRPVVLELLKRYADREIHVFHTRQEAGSWLEGVTEMENDA